MKIAMIGVWNEDNNDLVVWKYFTTFGINIITCYVSTIECMILY